MTHSEAQNKFPGRKKYPQSLRRKRNEFRIADVFFISAGVLSAAYGLKGFLLPNSLIDGGVTGISLLTSELSGIPLSVLILLINLPFIFMGYKQQGIMFTIKTFCSIALLAFFVYYLQFPLATNDRVLVSVFGGFFLGLGIGLCIRGGAVIDGTEVLAVYLSRISAVTIGDIILSVNIIIFTVASFLLSFEVAMYSLLTYLSASKTVDFVVHGIEEYTGVTIVSEKSEEIREMIIYDLQRGVTIYKGKRGFGTRGHHADMDVVFTVVTRLEIARLKRLVLSIDPRAFVVMHSINEARGGMVKRRRI